MGLALALGAGHVGTGGRNSERCAVGVLGAGARAVDRNSPRLFLQGANQERERGNTALAIAHALTIPVARQRVRYQMKDDITVFLMCLLVILLLEVLTFFVPPLPFMDLQIVAVQFFTSACLPKLFALGDGSSSIGEKWQAMLYWGAVKREWAHPIRSNFVFTPFLASLTLVGAAPLPVSRGEPWLSDRCGHRFAVDVKLCLTSTSNKASTVFLLLTRPARN